MEIIRQRARYSLSITVPALAMGWAAAMVVSCLVAYYRGTWIDRVGVFLSVLGMCVPYLAYMVIGQWLVFELSPPLAFGLRSRVNIYIPVIIAVLAGLGANVRFYRTVILDEVNRDYVRTAMAKGVPMPTVMFHHVLKNCMLPILTNLVLAIPFLILGSLLLERFFGIPGLGGLMLSSIMDRDVPIVTGLTFLTAVIYTAGLADHRHPLRGLRSADSSAIGAGRWTWQKKWTPRRSRPPAAGGASGPMRSAGCGATSRPWRASW